MTLMTLIYADQKKLKLGHFLLSKPVWSVFILGTAKMPSS
jgi:hypothetical protein